SGDEPPQIDYYDAEKDGLSIRIGRSGRMSWVLSVRVPRDKRMVPTRLTLGTFPKMSINAAREAADAAREQIKEGKDPTPTRVAVRRKVAKDDTFAAWRDKWFEMEGSERRP